MSSVYNKHGRQIVLILIVCALAVIVYLVVRGLSQDEESRIRKVVYNAVVCVEKEDIGRCSRLISERYEDKAGNTRFIFLKILSQVFDEYESFKIDIKKLDVTVEGSSASADIGFVCYFKQAGKKQLYYDKGKLDVKFEKEGGAWKVTRAEYSGSGEILYLQGVA